MPASDDSAARWQRTYAERPAAELSWTEAFPSTSLDLIAEAELPGGAALVDVGGGASGLAGELLRAGYGDVTVADISTVALDRAQADLGEDAGRVTWIEAETTTSAVASTSGTIAPPFTSWSTPPTGRDT